MGKKSFFLKGTLIWTILFVDFISSYTICPSVCTCKWKNGKQTAECVGQGLTLVPAELNTATQVIDLSVNNFHEIPSRVFQKKSLVNLQKIFLMECGITNIASDAFFQLSNLVELDLTNNNLSVIPAEALGDCPHLRRLQLARNPIKMIRKKSLASLVHLIFLDLSYCIIETLHPDAFSGLKSLEILKLDGNHLTALSVQVVRDLTQLSGLHLNNNPWYCDCNIRDIRQWMIVQNIPLGVPPQCSDPPYAEGITWDKMSLEDFACPPNIIAPASTEFTVLMGHNISILCRVDSVPKAYIFWEVGGRYLINISSTVDHHGKYLIETNVHSSRLFIINAVETDSETYTCNAENKAGNISLNFTIFVASPNNSDESWSNTQIIVLLIGVCLIVIMIATIVCFFIFHPTSFTDGSKFRGVTVINHLTAKKQEVVEMNDVSCDKQEKELKTSDKAPDKNSRNETGSSGYGSDQLTPDLVSKISETKEGSNMCSSNINYFNDSHNAVNSEGYDVMNNSWSTGKASSQIYDNSPGRSFCSEIYANPCYGKDDFDSYLMNSPTRFSDLNSDRIMPLNNRVQKLRGCFVNSGSANVNEGVRDDFYINSASNDSNKRQQLTNNANYYTLPTKARFSPDEGYAEEALEGTEV